MEKNTLEPEWLDHFTPGERAEIRTRVKHAITTLGIVQPAPVAVYLSQVAKIRASSPTTPEAERPFEIRTARLLQKERPAAVRALRDLLVEVTP